MNRPDDTTSIAAIVRALAVSNEHGGAALVVGGALPERRAWLGRIASSIAGIADGPLVVQVRARSNHDTHQARGSWLTEEIASAAEAALVAAGAPGGLYDDASGGPLASLAGWLFRARSVRRRGIVLAIEDLDTWLDGRGGTALSEADASALAVVTRVLDEGQRRALSLVATVRASDAGGAPALPADLAQRFAHIETLGGAATVTRDPTLLVAALAGRSFSLAALKNALAGWLDVPGDQQDTVVVFTSPLAPPAIDAPNESDALEWGAAEAVSPSGRESVSRPPPDTELAVESALGESWAPALRAAVAIREALRTMQDLGAPKGFRQFERVYREAASHLPLALAALDRGERSLGLEGTRLRARGAESLARFEAAFNDYYPDAFETWMAGTPRPTMLCDLPGRLARIAADRGARGTALVLLTGLRLDAWRRIQERVLPGIRGLQMLEEGVTWAARPVTPATQREQLARGLSALGATLPRRDEPTPPRSIEEALRPRREHLGHTEVLRIDAYATELSKTDASLESALSGLERVLPDALRALCGGLSPRTVLCLASDVGLREVTRGTDEKERGRFAYGGDSVFETIVPFAVLTWGETK